MKKLVLFLSVVMSANAYAQMRAVSDRRQASQVREAVRSALSRKTLSCQVLQGSQDLQNSIGNSDSIKLLADSVISVSSVAAQDDAQPLLEFSLDYGNVTKVLITSSDDRKDIQQLTYEIYQKIRINNGNLLNPQMTDGLQLNVRVQCQ